MSKGKGDVKAVERISNLCVELTQEGITMDELIVALHVVTDLAIETNVRLQLGKLKKPFDD